MPLKPLRQLLFQLTKDLRLMDVRLMLFLLPMRPWELLLELSSHKLQTTMLLMPSPQYPLTSSATHLRVFFLTPWKSTWSTVTKSSSTKNLQRTRWRNSNLNQVKFSPSTSSFHQEREPPSKLTRESLFTRENWMCSTVWESKRQDNSSPKSKINTQLYLSLLLASLTLLEPRLESRNALSTTFYKSTLSSRRRLANTWPNSRQPS